MYRQTPDRGQTDKSRSQRDFQSHKLSNNYYGGNAGRMGEQENLASEQDELQNPRQAQQPQTSQEPQHNGAYVLIPPNQSKREKLLRMARKEQEEYDQFLESRRPGPINLPPERLGGNRTQANARQKQQLTQSQSKYQKMLQRDEHKRRIKAEEDAKLQEMKDIQRRKAEKLEEKKRQENLMREKRWQEDRHRTNNAFLDRFSQPVNSCPVRSDWGNTSHAWEEEDWGRQRREEDTWHGQEEDDADMLRAIRASLQTQEEEERRRHKSKMETRLRQQKEQERHRQKSLHETQPRHANRESYKQQVKEEEERWLQEMKAEQRRKSELLEKMNEMKEEERKLSEQEKQRRVNKAFLDRLQGQNAEPYKYTGETNTWGNPVQPKNSFLLPERLSWSNDKPNTHENRTLAEEVAAHVSGEGMSPYTFTQIKQHRSDIKRQKLPWVRRFYPLLLGALVLSWFIMCRTALKLYAYN